MRHQRLSADDFALIDVEPITDRPIDGISLVPLFDGKAKRGRPIGFESKAKPRIGDRFNFTSAARPRAGLG